MAPFMAVCWKLFILNCIVFCPSIVTCQGWTNEDLELFDVVEEVNQNFYDLLDVPQTASASDIRRAYRKLSLQLHPDKNKEEDAELRFRHLVSVYEILKDEDKRIKYNEVLVNGLPDWRQPIYYYRRVRKMGLIELGLLLLIILTVGQFLVSWATYAERRFEKEEVYRARKKRERKAHRKQIDVDIDEQLEAELGTIQRPLVIDLLPCLIVRQLVRIVMATPSFLAVSVPAAVASIQSRLQRRAEDDGSEEDENADTSDRVKRIRKRATATLPTGYESTPSVQPSCHGDSHYDLQTSLDGEDLKVNESKEWSDADLALLAKAVIKYPGVTPGRWEKIAVMLRRTVNDVSSKAKEVRTRCARTVDPSSQGITASQLTAHTAHNIDSELTMRDQQPPDTTSTTDTTRRHLKLAAPLDEHSEQTMHDEQPHNTTSTDDTTQRRNKPAIKTTERILLMAAGERLENGVSQTAEPVWTQQQQRLLETALAQYPKGTIERWDRIADVVPGKTKDECVVRFKYLADVVKRKQKQT